MFICLLLLSFISKIIGIVDEMEEDAAAEDKVAVANFMIKYNTMARNSCTDCRRPIKSKELCIMRVVDETKEDKNKNNVTRSGTANWYHVACFVRQRSEIGWLCSGDLLPGFRRLSTDDKETIQKQIP